MWTGFDTYGTSLQPAVFGDINSLSVREVDLHFVTEREVFSRGRAESWKDAHGGGGLLRQRGGYYF